MKHKTPDGTILDIKPQHKRNMFTAILNQGGYKLLFRYINWSKVAFDFHRKLLRWSTAKTVYKVKLLNKDTIILPETAEYYKIMEMIKHNLKELQM